MVEDTKEGGSSLRPMYQEGVLKTSSPPQGPTILTRIAFQDVYEFWRDKNIQAIVTSAEVKKRPCFF
jgi:hypothetical protein